MNTQESNELSLGEPIENLNSSPTPPNQVYSGEFVVLHPVEPEKDVDELYLNSHGSVAKEQI